MLEKEIHNHRLITGNVEADFSKTFIRDPDAVDFQVRRFSQDPGPTITENCVYSEKELRELDTLQDFCQIFYVSQRNSFSRLNISSELFEQFLHTYAIFNRMWDFIVPFRFKTKESDIGTASFKFRQIDSLVLPDGSLGSFECAYGLRYVELNHRPEEAMNDLDHQPWSVRQSAVYQQYDSHKNRTMLLIIAPSPALRKNLEAEVFRVTQHEGNVNSFETHRIILITLHDNWRIYLRSLEQVLMLQVPQSDYIILAEAGTKTGGFSLGFLERQRLKNLEDRVLDAVLIFESLRNTLTRLQQQCRKHCREALCVDCRCFQIVHDLEEQADEVGINLGKADLLLKRVRGTSQLLSDLLDYENSQIAHLNSRSLSGLAQDSKDESLKMRMLTERSARDAAAVKILTVITLFYLPMTVVASIFSSQLIRVSDSGHVSIVSGSWWFVVISAPLTVVTFLLWRYWLHHVVKGERSRASSTFKTESDTVAQWHPKTEGAGLASWICKQWHKRRNNRLDVCPAA